MSRTKTPQPSDLQIMCQYQIPAILVGVNPAEVFSNEFVAGVRSGYAQRQTPTKRRKYIPYPQPEPGHPGHPY
ncbi:MAG: hypothetical protein AABX17_03745 [Nanoarchaeota archaeon]